MVRNVSHFYFDQYIMTNRNCEQRVRDEAKNLKLFCIIKICNSDAISLRVTTKMKKKKKNHAPEYQGQLVRALSK